MADFLSTLQAFESGDWRHPERGGTNIKNTTQGTSSGQAQGFNQITTGTWDEFGGRAYAPTPLQATQAQQNAIAAKIPLGRWAPETLAFLRNNGFAVSPKLTLAENIANNHGTMGVAPPPHTPTPGVTPSTALGTTLTSLPNMGIAPSTVTPPDFGKPKPADQQKPAEPDKPPQAPDFQLNPLPLHRPDMVQSAQMQQAMGYQPPPVYGVGLTSTPGQFSSAPGAGQQQAQQPFGQNPMLMQLVQQIAMQQAQGQSPYGSYGGGYGGY